MEKNINFQMEEIVPDWLNDYPEDKFTVFKACFLSTQKNSHNLDISADVLKRDAQTILGNFLVAKLQYGDASTHLPSEIIYGYFPKEQEIEFEETEDNIVKAWAYCVISKQYGQEFNEIFDLQNLRNTSVEMKIKVVDDAEEGEVESFDIYGLTCLGLSVKGSCPDAMMTMIRFSQEDADAYFNKMNEHNLTPLKKFAKERIENMAKTYKIDKSKEALSDKAWGDVDKSTMRDKIMEADNKTTLVKAVYMLVEDGWEDAPSEHLKYPVMELKGDTFVYNRDGLASALGYAKKENETAVVNKIEKIYKKLDLDDNEGGKEEKMAEIEFSAVNIGDLWGHVYHAIHEHDAWDYCIQGIYEENNQKFAVLIDRDQKMYRMNFTLTEEGFDYDDELVEVKQEFTETDNIKKFAEPENAEQYTKFADPEPENKSDDGGKGGKAEMSADEMKAEIARLQGEIDSRDNIIMARDDSIKEKDIEREDLRAFKKACLEAERGSKVDAIMAEVAKFMDKAQAEEYRNEGLTCEFAEVDAWANKVKAVVFEKVTKTPGKEEEFTRMSAPVETKKSGSVWDRL